MKDDQNEKIAALEVRIAELEAFCALLKRGLEKAHTLLDLHQKSLEGLTGSQPPDPGTGSKN